MKVGLFKFCISTIVKKSKLDEFADVGGGQVRQGGVWMTGQALLHEAQQIEAGMPVIFSDAARNSEKLIYWAILDQITVDDKGTIFSFNNMRKIRRGHYRQELILRSTGKPIAETFIKPYAICETPDFLE